MLEQLQRQLEQLLTRARAVGRFFQQRLRFGHQRGQRFDGQLGLFLGDASVFRRGAGVVVRFAFGLDDGRFLQR